MCVCLSEGQTAKLVLSVTFQVELRSICNSYPFITEPFIYLLSFPFCDNFSLQLVSSRVKYLYSLTYFCCLFALFSLFPCIPFVSVSRGNCVAMYLYVLFTHKLFFHIWGIFSRCFCVIPYNTLVIIHASLVYQPRYWHDLIVQVAYFILTDKNRHIVLSKYCTTSHIKKKVDSSPSLQ